MKVVLCTGSAGFVGAHLVDYLLLNTDHSIVGLDRLDFSGNLNRLAELDSVRNSKGRFRQVFHDLRGEINPLLAKQIGPVDWVLHLAAASHVDRSIADPLSFVLDNVVGTCNILNFTRVVGAKFYQMSTDEVHGPATDDYAFKEWDRYKSGNIYSASKASAEELCLAFQNTYKMHIVIGRGMNIIGIRQHVEKMVPSTIRKVLAGEEVLIHADATCTIPGARYYIDAKEVSRAIHFLMLNEQSGDKVNIVGEKRVSNLELAQGIADIIGKPLKYKLISWHASRPGHDLLYNLDGSKLKAMGFERQLYFDQALEQTVEWTLANPNWL